LAVAARRPIQELATEWAAKKPAVIRTMPPTIAHRLAVKVSPTPASMVSRPPPSTWRRPSLSASAPATDEAVMPNT